MLICHGTYWFAMVNVDLPWLVWICSLWCRCKYDLHQHVMHHGLRRWPGFVKGDEGRHEGDEGRHVMMRSRPSMRRSRLVMKRSRPIMRRSRDLDLVWGEQFKAQVELNREVMRGRALKMSSLTWRREVKRGEEKRGCAHVGEVKRREDRVNVDLPWLIWSCSL